MCSSGILLFFFKSLVISQYLFSIITANDSEGQDVDGFNKFWLALQVISNAKYRNKCHTHSNKSHQLKQRVT